MNHWLLQWHHSPMMTGVWGWGLGAKWVRGQWAELLKTAGEARSIRGSVASFLVPHHAERDRCRYKYIASYVSGNDMAEGLRQATGGSECL